MSVCFTNQNIHVQFIDDMAGSDAGRASTRTRRCPTGTSWPPTSIERQDHRRACGQGGLEQGIKQVVFDRGGARYHGKIKALADAAREAGLKF